MTKFISVFEFAKKNKTSNQNVYRWIRERKIKEEDIQIEEKIVKRIRVRSDLIL